MLPRYLLIYNLDTPRPYTVRTVSPEKVIVPHRRDEEQDYTSRNKRLREVEFPLFFPSLVSLLMVDSFSNSNVIYTLILPFSNRNKFKNEVRQLTI